MDFKTFSLRKPRIIGEDKIRKYAVLVPIIKIKDELFLLFEKRSQKLNSQPGEICFPGGKLEVNESLEECAIRETVEELAIDNNQISILGPGDIFLSPFNIIIYPYLGVINDYNDTFSKDEVEEVIKVPLNFFLSNQPTCYISQVRTNPPEDFPYEWIPSGKDYPWSKGEYDIFFYQYQETIIWGITARIVDSMINLIKKYQLFEIK